MNLLKKLIGIIKKYNPFADKADVVGTVDIVLKDENGKVKEKKKIHNLVVTAGKNHIADQLASSPSESAMSHMAVGTGTTSPSASDTALESELDRQALDSRTASGNVVTYVASWAAGEGTGAITEAGIFNAASGGTMLARTTFSAINKGASDTLEITWTLTIG